MGRIAWLMSFALIAGCAGPAPHPHRPANTATDAGAAAIAACKSALALRSAANSVFVLPISHAPYGSGHEVFLSLNQAQWLCTTDARGNVDRLERR